MKHIELASHQCKNFTQCILNAKDGQLVAVQDFTKYFITQQEIYNSLVIAVFVPQSMFIMEEIKKSKKKIPTKSSISARKTTLGMTITKSEKKKKGQWFFLEFVERKSKIAGQTHEFVRSCWSYVFGIASKELTEKWDKRFSSDWRKEIDFKGKDIFLWSDGARQHFKQNKSLHFWMEMIHIHQFKIHLNFFFSYHGHNPCDGRAGVCKMAIKRAFKEDRAVKDVDGLVDVISQIKNSFVLPIHENEIDRKTKFPETSVKGICTSYHLYEVEGEKLVCRLTSSTDIKKEFTFKQIKFDPSYSIDTQTVTSNDDENIESLETNIPEELPEELAFMDWNETDLTITESELEQLLDSF